MRRQKSLGKNLKNLRLLIATTVLNCQDIGNTDPEVIAMEKSVEKRRLIGVTKPAFPLFCVYYDESENLIFTSAVVCLVLYEVETRVYGVEKRDGRYTYQDPLLVPVTVEEGSIIPFNLEGETFGSCNYLGLSREESPSRGEWQGAIKRYLERKKYEAAQMKGEKNEPRAA